MHVLLCAHIFFRVLLSKKKKNLESLTCVGKREVQIAASMYIVFIAKLVAALPVAHDNPFRVVSLSFFFFFENWTNLIKNNIFYNHIFI